jgi:hypothetical protein
MSQADGQERRFREIERRVISQDGYTLSFDGFPPAPHQTYRLWRDGAQEPIITFATISEAAIYVRDVLKLKVAPA